MKADAGVGPAPARNLELKVRCEEPMLGVAGSRLGAAGVPLARFAQVDTYFAVTSGRLKLREIKPESGDPIAELIAYARPDVTGPRWSVYRTVPILVAEAAGLKAALTDTVGVLTVVVKTREVGRRGRTRVHLDAVAGLGTFVELETVVDSEEDGSAEAELTAMAALVGIDTDGDEVVAGSYADLLLAARRAAG
jgi:adenylate cyclase class IV